MKDEAVLFLSELRGQTQSGTHRSFHSFNFGSYQNEFRRPFHRLNAFNDETLLPRASVVYAIPFAQEILLVPVIGAVQYNIDHQNDITVDAGESVLLVMAAGSVLTITNPFESEAINFTSAWFKYVRPALRPSVRSTFDLDGCRNTLVPVFARKEGSGYIGKFSGRSSLTVQIKSMRKAAFVFVIE